MPRRSLALPHATLAGLTGACAVLAAQIVPTDIPIVIDGTLDDWAGVPAIVVDEMDAPAAEVDLGEVRVMSDGQFAHLLVGLGRSVNVQRLDGRLELALDADGNPATGSDHRGHAGIDYVVMFTPPRRDDVTRAGMGFGVRGGRGLKRDLSPYDLGLTFGPTFASDRIEIRLERRGASGRLADFLGGESFTGRFVLVNTAGDILDETAPFTHSLATNAATAPPAQATDPLARSRAGLRVMSWNLRYGAFVEQIGLARKILDALDPDVVLVQEMTEGTTGQQLERILNTGEEHRPWHAFVSGGGGNLRSGVLSRLPMRPAGIEPIAYPHQAGRYLRTAAVEITVDDRRVLVVSTHLKCCGRIGDRSDEKRVVETGTLRTAVRELFSTEVFDAVVVGGDLNLVGGYRPLEILESGLDVDGSALAIASPLQLDGRSNATWFDREQPFVPGRLDYLLYSDSAFDARNAFVFQSADLAPQWREAHGLPADATETVTDHYPVVLDLRWRD